MDVEPWNRIGGHCRPFEPAPESAVAHLARTKNMYPWSSGMVDRWPSGSTRVRGLLLAYAYRSALAEWGTGLLAALSRLSNWPVLGLYQRAAMLTRPLDDSVNPD